MSSIPVYQGPYKITKNGKYYLNDKLLVDDLKIAVSKSKDILVINSIPNLNVTDYTTEVDEYKYVKIDAPKLFPENIKKDISIFGVTGIAETLSEKEIMYYSMLDNSDATNVPNVYVNTTITAIADRAFYRNSHISVIDVSNVRKIGYMFKYNSTLTKIILRYPGIVSIGKFSFFGNPKPNIYVPDDLVDQYKAATNWSRLSSYIFGISSL